MSVLVTSFIVAAGWPPFWSKSGKLMCHVVWQHSMWDTRMKRGKYKILTCFFPAVLSNFEFQKDYTEKKQKNNNSKNVSQQEENHHPRKQKDRRGPFGS